MFLLVDMSSTSSEHSYRLSVTCSFVILPKTILQYSSLPRPRYLRNESRSPPVVDPAFSLSYPQQSQAEPGALTHNLFGAAPWLWLVLSSAPEDVSDRHSRFCRTTAIPLSTWMQSFGVSPLGTKDLVKTFFSHYNVNMNYNIKLLPTALEAKEEELQNQMVKTRGKRNFNELVEQFLAGLCITACLPSEQSSFISSTLSPPSFHLSPLSAWVPTASPYPAKPFTTHLNHLFFKDAQQILERRSTIITGPCLP